MNITKIIEPNQGVNVLEEDSDQEADVEVPQSSKEQSIFSTVHSKFKIVKQGEPYQPNDSTK